MTGHDDPHRQSPLDREADRGHHVRGAGGADDQRGVRVQGQVEGDPFGVVASLSGQEHRSLQRGGQFVQIGARERDHLLITGLR